MKKKNIEVLHQTEEIFPVLTLIHQGDFSVSQAQYALHGTVGFQKYLTPADKDDFPDEREFIQPLI